MATVNIDDLDAFMDISSHPGPTRVIEPAGVYSDTAVVAIVHGLARRSKDAVRRVELDDVVVDMQLLESAALDVNTKAILMGQGENLQKCLEDYTREFSLIISPEHLLFLQKTKACARLCNIASDILFRDVDDAGSTKFMLYCFRGDNLSFNYDPDAELKLKIMEKQYFFDSSKVFWTSYNDSKHIWKLVRSEVQYRKDAINPIRKLNDNFETINPGRRWNLTRKEYDDDIGYLRMIYVTQDIRVIQLRWEWGKRFWSLHARRTFSEDIDVQRQIEEGRRLELEARKHIIFLDVIKIDV